MSLDLAARLRAAAASLPATGRVRLDTLAHAHGSAAQGTLLVLLAAPCVLPVPGVGSVLGLGLLALAVGMWAQRGAQAERALPERVAQVDLPSPWAARVLTFLAGFYEHAARWARPRWPTLTGASSQPLVALGTAMMGVLIVLPIPFGNLLPAASLMLAGLALALRDGIAMLAAGAVGFAALLISLVLTLLGVQWVQQLGALLLN